MAETDHGLLSAPRATTILPRTATAEYRGGTIGASPAYSFTAHVAEVEVDAETGIVVNVKNVWVAHDCGKALIATRIVEGQMEGSVYMGFAEAIMEQHIVDPDLLGGVHTGPSLLDYRIPTFEDTPEIVSLIVEHRRRPGPLRCQGSRRRVRSTRSFQRSRTPSTTRSACA